MKNDPLVVDPDLWKTGDKDWKRERERLWSVFEPLLLVLKQKKAIPPIKRFFLRGTLPDWTKINEKWPNELGRHLDLFTFLWLHPSRDAAELRSLKDAYGTAGCGRVAEDVRAGYFNFWYFAVHVPSTDGWVPVKVKGISRAKALGLVYDDKIRTLTEILFEDLPLHVFKFGRYDYDLRPVTVLALDHAGRWLTLKPVGDCGRQMALQHPSQLDFIRRLAVAEPDDAAKSLVAVENAFRCVVEFDTEAEGDSRRTDFVDRIRRMLDEEEWPEAIAALWEDVKSGG